MFYYLLEYINKVFNPPGFDLFRFLTFRAALSAISSLFLSLYLGPKLISYLRKKQIGEAKKIDGPKSHWSKAGTPTMGGIIIIFSIIVPVLLWSDIKSVYIILVMVGT
ncbi:MAG: phospho-N-acetylmuramoyl-pentapeptide-transferase, partial [Bacteroidota bacterium]